MIPVKRGWCQNAAMHGCVVAARSARSHWACGLRSPLAKAQDRAIDNYKKTKGGGTMATKTAAGAPKK